MVWFKKTSKPIAAAAKVKASRVPEGLWAKCPGCSQLIYHKDLAANLSVCPARTTSDRRAPIACGLFDDGVWVEHDRDPGSTDPLQFTDTKPYRG